MVAQKHLFWYDNRSILKGDAVYTDRLTNMIAYIRGIVEDISEDNVVLDVHDIGYNVKISADTAGKLPGAGEVAKLYTYTLVKEDAFQLYGFLTRDELELFKLCITVSGIGPKGAQAILSVMDTDSLRFAIMSRCESYFQGSRYRQTDSGTPDPGAERENYHG